MSATRSLHWVKETVHVNFVVSKTESESQTKCTNLQVFPDPPPELGNNGVLLALAMSGTAGTWTIYQWPWRGWRCIPCKKGGAEEREVSQTGRENGLRTDEEPEKQFGWNYLKSSNSSHSLITCSLQQYNMLLEATLNKAETLKCLLEGMRLFKFSWTNL